MPLPGKSGVLGFIQCVLMISIAFLAIPVLYPALCMSIRTHDPSIWSPAPFGLSECYFTASIGKFVFLKHLDVF